MNVAVVFFSQTGNTRKIAKAISDGFHSQGHMVKMNSLVDAHPNDIRSADLFGIGTPCFSSQAPQPIMNYIKSLPPMIDQNAFIFVTCGGAPGRVLLDMKNGLRNKGINVICSSIFRGKVHHPAPILTGRFPDRPNDQDLKKAHNFARTICSLMSSYEFNTPLPDEYKIPSKRWGFYEFLGSAVFEGYLRFFLPKPKLQSKHCNLCEQCAQECPIQNISLQPYPVLGKDCIRCYHCHNICSSRAFTVNWIFSNPLLWLLYNQTFVRWFGNLEPGEKIY
jgi:flavodoxin